MDLSFVDPPIPAGAQPYDPLITAENAGAKLERIADWVGSDELPASAFQDDAIANFTRALREPRAAGRYATSLPMVARFLTIELDPEIEGENGIGRVPGEPPPRFGGRFRKQLRDREIRRRLGEALEKLIFNGYASMVAASGTRTDPFNLLDRSLEERWWPFIRNMAPTYRDLVAGLNAEKRPSQTTILVLGGPAIADYAELIAEVKLGRGLRPFSKSRAKSYATFFIAVGNALWAANTDLTSSAAA